MQDYLIAKLASMIGGLFGGSTILTFIKPKTVGEAFMRGGVSVGTATAFASPLLVWLNLPNTWDNQLVSGFITGFLAFSVLGMVANFLIKNQNKDIVEAIKEIKK